jgi:hypothetical protein
VTKKDGGFRLSERNSLCFNLLFTTIIITVTIIILNLFDSALGFLHLGLGLGLGEGGEEGRRGRRMSDSHL